MKFDRMFIGLFEIYVKILSIVSIEFIYNILYKLWFQIMSLIILWKSVKIFEEILKIIYSIAMNFM